jgi:hypothetical protein
MRAAIRVEDPAPSGTLCNLSSYQPPRLSDFIAKTDIIKGRRGITADTALRLARFYGNSAQFWLNLQSQYDLEVTDATRINTEVTPLAA